MIAVFLFNVACIMGYIQDEHQSAILILSMTYLNLECIYGEIKMNKQSVLSMSAVAAAGVLWGCIGIFVRTLNTMGFKTMDIVLLRAAVTAPIMIIILLIFNREQLKIKIKDVWCFVGTGIGSIVFFNYCYFKTMVTASLPVAAVLLYTAPAMVIIISAVLFGEKLTMRKILAAVLAFIGSALVSGISGNDKMNALSLLTGLSAGFGYAMYSVFSRFAIKRGYGSATISAYTFLFALLGTIPLSDVSETMSIIASNVNALVFVLMFGIISTVFPYALYTWGLKHVENGKASIIASIELVVASLIGVLAFKEYIGIGAVAGIIMVLGSIVMCSEK